MPVIDERRRPDGSVFDSGRVCAALKHAIIGSDLATFRASITDPVVEAFDDTPGPLDPDAAAVFAGFSVSLVDPFSGDDEEFNFNSFAFKNLLDSFSSEADLNNGTFEDELDIQILLAMAKKGF